MGCDASGSASNTAVALLGINLSNEQQRILRKIPKIVLMLDGDIPGRKARNAYMINSKQHCRQADQP